jgi:epoxyqueuosine reductase
VLNPEQKVKQLAREAGFDLCGVASLSQPPERLGALIPWLERGQHGSMAWLERQAEKRLDPAKILPGARSLISVGLVYNTAHPYSTDLFPLDGRRQTRPASMEGRAWVSRYAWGDDYHDVMQAKLAGFERALREQLDAQAGFRSYSDTGPISEKAWAAAAGLGWQGKHTNVINRELGSWFFLGEVLSTLDLQPDAPAADHCGSCTRCLDACPTQALTPYQLDATRCLSYLSIEVKGELPAHLGGVLGANVYGCDICQDVCPWNGKRVLGHEPAFEPRPGLLAPRLDWVDQLGDIEFSEAFRHSAMKRTKRSGLQRNSRLSRPKGIDPGKA